MYNVPIIIYNYKLKVVNGRIYEASTGKKPVLLNNFPVWYVHDYYWALWEKNISTEDDHYQAWAIAVPSKNNAPLKANKLQNYRGQIMALPTTPTGNTGLRRPY